MPLRQEPEPQILRHIGILILVHQNIAKEPLVLGQDFAVVLENCHHMQQQVTKICGIQFAQASLILP